MPGLRSFWPTGTKPNKPCCFKIFKSIFSGFKATGRITLRPVFLLTLDGQAFQTSVLNMPIYSVYTLTSLPPSGRPKAYDIVYIFLFNAVQCGSIIIHQP
jgi:hypothetical protein